MANCSGLLVSIYSCPGGSCIRQFIERVTLVRRHLYKSYGYLPSRALVEPCYKAFQEHLLRMDVEPLRKVPPLQALQLLHGS